MQKTLTSWLLTALIISLSFGQLLRFEIYGLPFYFHDFLILSILIANIPFIGYKVSVGLKVFLIGLIIGWVRAATIYPFTALVLPMGYTLRLLSYLLLYLVIKKRPSTNLDYAFLVAGSISLLIGLLQYFLMPDMRIFQYLGWDDHLNRLTMPQFDPSFAGAMLAMFFLRSQSLFQASTIFYLLGILLTYARSIWLSILLTYAFTTRKLIILFILVGVLLVSTLFLPKRFGEGTNLLRTFSISSRVSTDLAYITRYKFDLIFGRGFNTLILDKESSKFANHATSPNNSYLYLLVTSGIIGLVGWGMFLKELYSSSLFKPLVMFIIFASLFNNVMFYPFTLLLLLLSNTEIVS